jgi:hypothetical protein
MYSNKSITFSNDMANKSFLTIREKKEVSGFSVALFFRGETFPMDFFGPLPPSVFMVALFFSGGRGLPPRFSKTIQRKL